MARLLVVEDDENFILGLNSTLRGAGHEVEVVGNGEAALERARQRAFELILLDINLPPKEGDAACDGVGYTVCEKLRRDGSAIPILMLTGNDSEAEHVLGFAVGADDYVVKPFRRLELRARINNLLRRGNSAGSSNIYRFGDVEVDFDRCEVRRDEQLIAVTPLEFKLLSAFICSRRRVLSRNQLLDKVWGTENAPTDRVIDNHVMNLRKKIEPQPDNPIYLVTVPSQGYLFEG